jgi:adenylate cyclase
VRYVLEGGIRRAGDRVRISAQLIDATTGAHRWAERYDRELSDVFAVQDEVARTIVTFLAAHVSKAETERMLLKPPATWEAYDYYLRAAQAFGQAFTSRTRASIDEARRFLEQSLSIDPGYARAYALLARTHAHTYVEPIDDDYLTAEGLDRAYELAKNGVQLDPNLPEAHSHFGWVLLFMRRHDAAIAEFERAFTLNPNFNDYSYGFGLICAGEPAKAIEFLQASLRRDPFQLRGRFTAARQFGRCRRHSGHQPTNGGDKERHS